MNLHDYNLVVINSSAGKDSLAAMWLINQMATQQNYPLAQVVVSHQCLGTMEWEGTKELAATQAAHFGLAIHYSSRRNAKGEAEDLLQYVERRGKWPSNKQRYCTSDFKRAPGARVITALTKDMGQCKVLQVYGFRAQESPARSKKPVLQVNKLLTTKKRLVHDYLPIHDWHVAQVWATIKGEGLPYHPAYDLGMPRLSCVFCIFSPFDALVIAGKANPALLQRYVDTERKIGHTFKAGMAIASVQEAIATGYQPKQVQDWVM